MRHIDQFRVACWLFPNYNACSLPKIQQTKMLVRCQLFGDLFLFGLVWQYSLIQKNIMKVGSKPRLLTSFSNITLSLPSLYFSESKRELNFRNVYLSLLYFCLLTMYDIFFALLFVMCALTNKQFSSIIFLGKLFLDTILWTTSHMFVWSLDFQSFIFE